MKFQPTYIHPAELSGDPEQDRIRLIEIELAGMMSITDKENEAEQLTRNLTKLLAMTLTAYFDAQFSMGDGFSYLLDTLHENGLKSLSNDELRPYFPNYIDRLTYFQTLAEQITSGEVIQIPVIKYNLENDEYEITSPIA